MTAVAETLHGYTQQVRNNRLGLWLFFVSEAFLFRTFFIGTPVIPLWDFDPWSPDGGSHAGDCQGGPTVRSLSAAARAAE